MNEQEHQFVALAREAIRQYSETGKSLQVSATPGDPPACGVFVSLHEGSPDRAREGPLRGCIGSTHAREKNLRTEITRSAIAAAFSDPRFPPLSSGEIDRLHITVYLLDEPEPVSSVADLDPERYGVLVEGSGRRGLLLPAIPGIVTAEQQLSIATSKAGLRPNDPVDLYRFEATILS
ncbi:MAG: AmmeMemoRadiSam system protein A [bacterium]|nr:AmmeMemoRadiSam system protein A [bacterium]